MRLDAALAYESFWRRMLAGCVDLALAIVILVTVVLLNLSTDATPPRAADLATDVSALARSAGWLTAAILPTQALFWTLVAATPGMLLLGSQVLDEKTRQRLSLGKSFARAVGLWVGLACLGVGVLWILRDVRHRGLHDKLVGSVVITEDESLLSLDELIGDNK